LKILFFTFYYPPDLSAGSFRSKALVRALEGKTDTNDEIHVVTTHPNRYTAYQVEAEDVNINGRVTVHRIALPNHSGGMASQALIYSFYAFSAYRISKRIKPDFLIATTGRLMTGVVAWIVASLLKKKYYIDIRDIFSEAISDLLSRKSVLIGATAKRSFAFLERKVLNNASGVNVVSEGFLEYFQEGGVDTSTWSFNPNGVDEEFINLDLPIISKKLDRSPITIFYAGNIGNGQGLEKIIPDTANRLGDEYCFVVVGDGATLQLLKEAIQKKGVNNVQLVPPVGRDKLVKLYKNADILFLHLNDFPAFLRVLPSKIFEYAALGKPIVAGLSGYSADFIEKQLPYVCLFGPCDVAGAERSILLATKFDVEKTIVSKFTNQFSREVIMDKMANSLIATMRNEK